MRPKLSKAEKLAERRVEQAYYKNCAGIQIDVFDISKVFRFGRSVVARGADDDVLGQAIFNYVQTIRRN